MRDHDLRDERCRDRRVPIERREGIVGQLGREELAAGLALEAGNVGAGEDDAAVVIADLTGAAALVGEDRRVAGLEDAGSVGPKSLGPVAEVAPVGSGIRLGLQTSIVGGKPQVR